MQLPGTYAKSGGNTRRPGRNSGWRGSMHNQTRRKGLTLGLILAGAALASAAPDDAQKPEALARLRLEIARSAYEGCETAITTPPAGEGNKLPQDVRTVMNVEQLVTWSRRWMEAERDMSGKKADQVGAVESHRKRLKKWED